MLLKLLGAERLLANGLTLLLNGVSIVSSANFSNLHLAEFLEKISPPTLICCLIVSLRNHSLQIGFFIASFPYLESMVLPYLEYGGSFIVGSVLGCFTLIQLLGREYISQGKNLEAS